MSAQMPSSFAPSGLREGVQYGALPFRCATPGTLEYLLISSRETGRWVIPKGWPKKGMPGWRIAEEEAFEEAGIRGRIGHTPIGGYRYIKWMPNRIMLCSVTLFPLCVDTELSNWPEQDERSRMWVSRNTASVLVDEPDLAEIMQKVKLPSDGGPSFATLPPIDFPS